MPISSITAAPATATVANPHNGPTAIRNAADPPVIPMSPSASPANDWPRMTVNTPTAPATTATTAQTVAAI